MWPWEHLALGYVCYALGRRAWDGRGPTNREAVVVAFGTQVPDLVDKPLAWEFGVLPSGLSLAHSIFFVLPVTLLAIAVARRRGQGPLGTAFGVGLLSHLAGDGLYPLLTGGGLSIDYMLWPLVPANDGSREILRTVPRLWSSFVQFLGTPRGKLYLTAELTFLGFALVLWLWDGAPGIPRPRDLKARS